MCVRVYTGLAACIDWTKTRASVADNNSNRTVELQELSWAPWESFCPVSLSLSRSLLALTRFYYFYRVSVYLSLIGNERDNSFRLFFHLSKRAQSKEGERERERREIKTVASIVSEWVSLLVFRVLTRSDQRVQLFWHLKYFQLFELWGRLVAVNQPIAVAMIGTSWPSAKLQQTVSRDLGDPLRDSLSSIPSFAAVAPNPLHKKYKT